MARDMHQLRAGVVVENFGVVLESEYPAVWNLRGQETWRIYPVDRRATRPLTGPGLRCVSIQSVHKYDACGNVLAIGQGNTRRSAYSAWRGPESCSGPRGQVWKSPYASGEVRIAIRECGVMLFKARIDWDESYSP